MRIPRLISKELIANKLYLKFETGEDRYFLISDLLEDLNNTGVAKFGLEDIVQSVIEDGIITFPSVKVKLTTPKGTIKKSYDLDPNYVFNNSISEEISFGEIFKTIRRLKKISQEEVAKRCKTDKGYISKFERDKIQVEWNTIRKLFYLGLEEKINSVNLLLEGIYKRTN